MYKSYHELGNESNQSNQSNYQVVEILSQEHKNDVLLSNQVVCVDIYADWCGPCKQTEPLYANLAEKYTKNGLCAIVKENHEKGLSSEVTGLPTYYFYVNGKKIQEQVVGANIQEVEGVLNKLLNNVENTQNNIPQYSRNSIRNYR
jgi:thioredoxin 1